MSLVNISNDDQIKMVRDLDLINFLSTSKHHLYTDDRKIMEKDGYVWDIVIVNDVWNPTIYKVV